MQVNERKVFDALGDPEWDWRTLAGLEQATGLPRAEILDVLSTHHSKIDTESSPEHGLIFRLKEHPKDQSILEKALDYMSLGARR